MQQRLALFSIQIKMSSDGNRSQLTPSADTRCSTNSQSEERVANSCAMKRRKNNNNEHGTIALYAHALTGTGAGTK